MTIYIQFSIFFFFYLFGLKHYKIRKCPIPKLAKEITYLSELVPQLLSHIILLHIERALHSRGQIQLKEEYHYILVRRLAPLQARTASLLLVVTLPIEQPRGSHRARSLPPFLFASSHRETALPEGRPIDEGICRTQFVERFGIVCWQRRTNCGAGCVCYRNSLHRFENWIECERGFRTQRGFDLGDWI